MKFRLLNHMIIATAALAAIISTPLVSAQSTEKNIMIVFDASGSMWGQTEGRTKIEIARDTLSSVLEETDNAMTLGMIAYGHRRKGQCSDIETVVAPGPATETVPAMISVAGQLRPKGKTPLTDAVRMAADELRYTENEVTVILVTDGIETCQADPCALASELENAGLNFTAHVIGFGLSEEDGRKVSCLAENTGGTYFSAGDTDALNAALAQSLSTEAETEPEPEPAVSTRNVHLFLRDTPQSERLTIRKVQVLPAESSAARWPENFELTYLKPYTGSGTFETGDYDVIVHRSGDGASGDGYEAKTSFTVEPGDGIQTIDLSLAARLRVVPYLNDDEIYDGKRPPKGAVKSNAWLYLHVYAVQDGALSEKPVFTGYSTIEDAVAPGLYLVRGTIDRTTTREKLVEVKAGETTEFKFNMGVSRVYINALENGQPVKRQTTYLYDKLPKGRNYWRKGYGGKTKTGKNNPFYLPPGIWVINTGNEGGGERRSEIIVQVERPGEEIRLDVPQGTRLSDEQKATITGPDYTPCIDYVGAKYSGCLVERPDLGAVSAGSQ
ncbi:MAG: VWA domain-containing protein [Pseudomonadota bacterium]